ncbi:MAG: hypothetical protein H6502_00260 [Candidatus Woesearchaeota archaeon]|nr:MAG: hypothetical protein H6502_00260 [Candidatus Woesearchaeota archaeon]
MAPKKKVLTKIKKKKKKWVKVVGPKMFQHAALADIYVTDAKDALGRFLSLNLATVTGDIKKQSLQGYFKVISIKEGSPRAFAYGFQMLPSFLKRLVRRGRTKIADSFLAKSKDGFVMRIKPLLVSQTKVPKSLATKIRLAAREKLKEVASQTNFEAFLEEAIFQKLRRTVKEACEKIYPIRTVEIRSLKMEQRHYVETDGIKGGSVDIDVDVPVAKKAEKTEPAAEESAEHGKEAKKRASSAKEKSEPAEQPVEKKAASEKKSSPKPKKADDETDEDDQ